MRKQLLHILLAYFALLMAGLALLTVMHAVPRGLLHANAKRSLETFQSEGTYPQFGLPFRRIILDNFTDPLMVNTAYFASGTAPFQDALLNTRGLLAQDEINQVKNLEATVGDTFTVRSAYARYWHGYTIVLRPLLAIMQYAQMRVILTGLLYVGFLTLVWQSWRKRGPIHAVALFAAALWTDLFYLGQSLQFSQVYLIGIFAALWYLWRKKGAGEDAAVLFFVTGGLTAFFDLLTAPIVTLGVLMIVAAEPKEWRRTFMQLLAWGAGYASIWLSKWVIVDLVLSQGLVRDAIGHVVNRTVTVPDPQFSYLRAIMLNVQQLIGYDRSNKFAALGIGMLALMVLAIFRRKQFSKQVMERVAFWLVLAVIPYGWYLFAANHSYLHVWYTYRTQFLSVAAFVLAYSELVDWKQLLAGVKSAAHRRRH